MKNRKIYWTICYPYIRFKVSGRIFDMHLPVTFTFDCSRDEYGQHYLYIVFRILGFGIEIWR